MKTKFTKISPANIQSLKADEIFVYGSNILGIHGAGAARLAHERFGAKMHMGLGLSGQSYGIPTKDSSIETLPLDKIQLYVTTFIKFAESRPRLKFLVTEIGCGLAGYTPEQIAPLFKQATNKNIYLPERFVNILNQIK